MADCKFCNRWYCMRDGGWRPSGGTIDGIEVEKCGRSLRAGEMVATWIELNGTRAGTMRFVFCMACHDAAVVRGVTETRFTLGTLENCLSCGYHPAVLADVPAWQRTEAEVKMVEQGSGGGGGESNSSSGQLPTCGVS